VSLGLAPPKTKNTLNFNALGSFDATVCCTLANKRLKPPASLIQQRQIPVCTGIFLNYQNQDRFTKTARRRAARERKLSAAARVRTDTFEKLGKQ